MSHISHYADDFNLSGGPIIIVYLQARADGAPVRPVAASKRVVDDRDGRRMHRVSLCEIAPGQNGNTHGTEIIRAGHSILGYGLLREGKRGAPYYDEVDSRIGPAQRQHRG